jgi:DNA-binding MurR/RpiR family transcriptional regulator
MSPAAQIPLMQALAERGDALPKTQRVLARHVLRNYQSVAFATITELARQTGVSEASVVRFANAFGYSGYPAFQKEIRRIVRADLKGTDRLQLADSADTPLARTIAKERENIAALEESHDPEALAEAVRILTGAREILIAGARSTASLAAHLWFALDKLRLPVTRLDATASEAIDRVGRLNDGGCLVAIGFPRYLRALVALVGLARERGARTIVITDSPFSALRGDVGLHAPAESASFVAFHAAPLILINTLIDALVRANPDRAAEALAAFESLAERERYFQPG